MSQSAPLALEETRSIIAAPFQVQAPARRGGKRRLPGTQEALAFLLSALGAATGVKWTNIHTQNGEPLAVALIPKAQFTEKDGQTALESLEP